MNAGTFNGWTSSIKWLRNILGGSMLLAVFVIGSAVPGARPVHACSCGYDPTTIASLLNSPNNTVFVGRATSVSAPNAQGLVTYTFAVDRSLKGNAGPTIPVQTATSGPTCGAQFPLDVSLGVALPGTGKEGFELNVCNAHIVTRNLAAFETFASGTLPAPPGSGPIAGVAKVGDDVGAVLDDQFRVLGYIPDLPGSSFRSCPGDRYLYGLYFIRVDSDGNLILGAFRVDLATLAVTKYTSAGLDSVYCLDSDGTLVLSGRPTDGSQPPAFVKTVTLAGVHRTIPSVPGYLHFYGPAGESNLLVWSTATEVVVTNADGVVVRRMPYNPWLGSPGRVNIIEGFLINESADQSSFSVTALVSGATFTVNSPYSGWLFASLHLYRLVNPTTLEAIEVPSGTRSQISITNGPNDPDWKLESATPNGSLILRYDTAGFSRPAAANFYVISPAGAATSYPIPSDLYSLADWRSGTFTSQTFHGEAWLLSVTGPQRVLNGYFVEPVIDPVTSGITLAPNACGKTSIPTSNYQCTLSPPLQRLPDTL